MTNKRNKECKHYSYDPQSGWDTCCVAKNPLFFNCEECPKNNERRRIKKDEFVLVLMLYGATNEQAEEVAELFDWT